MADAKKRGIHTGRKHTLADDDRRDLMIPALE
jgi:hypothetical protein